MNKLLTTLLLSFTLLTSAYAGDYASYRVTITNATAHQVITPPLVVSHSQAFQLFAVGSPASNGLAYQAENGDPSLVYGEVLGAAGVMDVQTGSGVVLPGHSQTIDIVAGKKAKLTLTAMLATTNDGFAALNAVDLPRKSATYFAYAYDAGSEMNNESCSHIPGPPCAADSGNARTDSGEGFVTIHSGIYGGNDLNPKQLDWRGPVAVVHVERLSD